MISVPRTEIVDEKTEKTEVNGCSVLLNSFELLRSETIVRPHSVWAQSLRCILPRVRDLNLKLVDLIRNPRCDHDAQTSSDSGDNQQRDCQRPSTPKSG